MKKENLRTKYLAQRQAMATIKYYEQNKQIQAHFFQQFAVAHYPCLHTYLSCPVRKEVDTWRLIHTILVKHPEIVIAAPKLLDRSGNMESYRIDRATNFQQPAWGMKEPISRARVPASNFLLVILPVIAFDKQGYRVGYGKGYYDRFLKQCIPAVTKVGLCFECPVPAIEDLNAYDVPMDYCVTPSQVFRWEQGPESIKKIKLI